MAAGLLAGNGCALITQALRFSNAVTWLFEQKLSESNMKTPSAMELTLKPLQTSLFSACGPADGCCAAVRAPAQLAANSIQQRLAQATLKPEG